MVILQLSLHFDGSIIGSGLIVLGLYVVLWGKRKENKKMIQLMPSSGFGESESVEIVVASLSKDDIKEGDDVREPATKESEAMRESFEEKVEGEERV